MLFVAELCKYSDYISFLDTFCFPWSLFPNIFFICVVYYAFIITQALHQRVRSPLNTFKPNILSVLR